MASQHVYKGCSDHEVFARSLRTYLQEWMQKPGIASPTDTNEKTSSSPLQSSSPQSRNSFHLERQETQSAAPALIPRGILRYLGRKSHEQVLDDNSSERNLFSGRSSRFRRRASELTIATLDAGSIGLQSGNRPDNGAIDTETYAEKLMILAKMEKSPMDPGDTDSWP